MKKTKATPKADQLRLVRHIVRELTPQDMVAVGGAGVPNTGCPNTCRDKYSSYLP